MLNIMLAFSKCDDVDIYGFGTAHGRHNVNKTLLVSDRLSEYHDWSLEQGIIRYIVSSGIVDLC